MLALQKKKMVELCTESKPEKQCVDCKCTFGKRSSERELLASAAHFNQRTTIVSCIWQNPGTARRQQNFA